MTKVSPQDIARLFSHANERPTFANLRWDRKPDPASRYVLVTAPPKSGSSWVTSVLAQSLPAERARYCYAYSSNEHDIYVPALLANQARATVSQLHCKATPHTIQLIREFGIRTVIVTRNPYDSVVSFARDLQKKSDLDVATPGAVGYAFVWLENCDPAWEQPRWIDYAIDHYMPWYLNFLSSWARFASTVNGKCIRYERLFSEPDATFADILQSVGGDPVVDRSLYETDFAGSNEMSGTRSPIGAGRESLSAQQITRIERYMDYCDDPWVRSHLDVVQ